MITTPSSTSEMQKANDRKTERSISGLSTSFSITRNSANDSAELTNSPRIP